MLYKNFDDLFVMDDKAVTACVNILETMDVVILFVQFSVVGFIGSSLDMDLNFHARAYL